MIGASGGGAESDVFATVLRNMFKMPIRIVTGYPGGTEITLAMQRHEVDEPVRIASGVPGHPPTRLDPRGRSRRGAAVPAVAVRAALGFVPASWNRIGARRAQQARWLIYVLLGGTVAATVGPYLVLMLITCGVAEVLIRQQRRATGPGTNRTVAAVLIAHGATAGGIGALVWVAFKVGALSYGGGFVIIPLMQHDAVNAYHWMTNAQFLNAVALGQVTPGPVVQTVAVVGYAAAGLAGGLLAAVVAFTPSFFFVLLGGPRFDHIRANTSIQAFLTGAGPAVVGAIAGSAIPLGLALSHVWQLAVLALSGIWLIALRKGVVLAIVGGGIAGAIAALAGAPGQPITRPIVERQEPLIAGAPPGFGPRRRYGDRAGPG